MERVGGGGREEKGGEARGERKRKEERKREMNGGKRISVLPKTLKKIVFVFMF